MKKKTLINHTPEELNALVAEKREALRVLRFGASGSKNKDVKGPRNLRKEIARALTELNVRRKAAPTAAAK